MDMKYHNVKIKSGNSYYTIKWEKPYYTLYWNTGKHSFYTEESITDYIKNDSWKVVKKYVWI